MNVFKSLCKFEGFPPRPSHSIFWVVLLGEFFVQHCMMMADSSGLGGKLLGVATLTRNEKIICYVLGFLSIPMNLIVKNIKVDNFSFVAGINLEKKDKNEFINKLMDWCDDKFNKFSTKMNEEDDDLNEMNAVFEN